MKASRTALGVALTLALALGGLSAADARPGGGGSPSSAKPAAAARPAPAAPKQATTTTTSSRAGGGGNTGMTRSSVMAEARNQSPSNAATNVRSDRPVMAGGGYGGGAAYGPAAGAGAGGGNYGAGYGSVPVGQPAQPVQRNGYSGAQLAGAAAAGAVGGYLLNEATRPHQPVTVNTAPTTYGQPQPTTSYVSPSGAVDGVMPQTQMQSSAMAQSQSSGMGGKLLGVLFFMALMGGIAYILLRRSQPAAASVGTGFGAGFGASSRAESSPLRAASFMTSESQLLEGASTLFRSIQDAYGRRDGEGLARHVDDSYLPSMLSDMEAEAQAQAPAVKVHSVKVIGNRVLGFERQDEREVGSIHFQADISEGSAPSYEIEEVWHFVKPRDGGEWKLAGIEQVNG